MTLRSILPSFIVLGIIGSAPSLAHATCTPWSPVLVAQESTAHPSSKLDFDWTNTVSNCVDSGFTFHHYEVCWNKGAYGSSPSAPATPAAAEGCTKVFSQGAMVAEKFVHRAYLDFNTRIFACDNADCTDIFGDHGDETVSNDDDDAQTEQEVYILEDITAYSDGDRTIDDAAANCSAALYYDLGWTYADQLALWWSTDNDGVQEIWYKRSDTAGWRSWNTLVAADWDDEGIVAEGTGGSGLYGSPTHPWVAAYDDATTRKIRLFVNTNNDGSAGPPYEIGFVDSVDEWGADFGLECDDGGDCVADGDTCVQYDYCDWEDDDEDSEPAVEGPCSNGLDACSNLVRAGHGRILRDYIGNGWSINFDTQTPKMIFTGANDDGTSSADGDCSATGTGQDDLYAAVWNNSSELWDVATDSGSPDCPVDESEDRHDPGIIPLPGDEYKRYAFEGLDTLHVAYWNGSTWEDESAVLVHFDDGSGGAGSAVDPYCFDNPDAIVYHDGSPVEGMFLHLMEDWGAHSCFDDAGIAYAEHIN